MPRCKLDWEDGDFDKDLLICDLDQQVNVSTSEDDDQDSQEKHEAKMTHFVTAGTFTVSVGAVALTGIYGLVTRDFGPLSAVWLVVAAPLGAIFARYVGKFSDPKLA